MSVIINYISENWIAILALVISIVNLIIRFFEMHTAKVEESKANILIIGSNNKLIISNIGKCNATNIRVNVDNILILNNPSFSQQAKKIDFSLLPAQNCISIDCLRSMGMKINFQVEVTYDDKYKKNNISSNRINL